MNSFKKIFLAIFLVGFTLSSLINWYASKILKEHIINEYTSKYLQTSSMIGNTLIQLEEKTEDVMKIALTTINIDTNIKKVSHYTPKGLVLGTIGRDIEEYKPETFSLPKSKIVDSKEFLTLYTKVKNHHPDCCEGKTFGQTDSATYYYVLETINSKTELINSLSKIRTLFFAIQFVLFVLSFFLSFLASKFLMKKINMLIQRINSFSDQTDQKSLILEGDDELSLLSYKFNELVLKQKESEKRRIAAEAKKVEGEIATQIVHDLRTPLAAVKHLFSSAEFEEIEDRTLFRDSINRLNQIVDSLKKYKETPNPSDLFPIHLYSTIKQIIAESSVENSKNISWSFECPRESLHLICLGNIVNFKRALSNIIVNAIDATGQKGKIRIQLKSENNNVVIRIHDNGCGVAPERIGSIFLPSFTHGKANGLGQGLYQAKNAITEMTGKIEVNSKLGKGTEFIVILPEACSQGIYTHRT